MRYKTSLIGFIRRRLFDLNNWVKPIHTRRNQTRSPQFRSVFIRHVDGGSCNAVELEIAALFNPKYDIEQYGFFLAASPRHADMMLLSGPITRGMETALLETFWAMPTPRKVVTVGDDFMEPNYYTGSYAIINLPSEIEAARVAHIPGDPPSPDEILKILLTLK
jgi:Ni,Fe-hydrogenase III small subunit